MSQPLCPFTSSGQDNVFRQEIDGSVQLSTAAMAFLTSHCFKRPEHYTRSTCIKRVFKAPWCCRQALHQAAPGPSADYLHSCPSSRLSSQKKALHSAPGEQSSAITQEAHASRECSKRLGAAGKHCTKQHPVQAQIICTAAQAVTFCIRRRRCIQPQANSPEPAHCYESVRSEAQRAVLGVRVGHAVLSGVE